MEKNTLISIVLPVYNGERYLSQSIESCLNQTYNNIELIIVNDCSVDNTLEIATTYALKDKRVKVINNVINKKLPASLNIGHEQAKGEYITWTSDDNLYLPNAIQVLYYQIKNNNVDFVYSDFYIINNKGTVVKERKLPKPEFCVWENVFGASFLYSKKVFYENDGYNENLFLVEDYDFWLKTILRFRFFKINEFLYKYRVHNNNLTFEIERKGDKYNLWKKNYKKALVSFYDNLTVDKDISSLIISVNEREKISNSNFIKQQKNYYKIISKLTEQNESFKKNEFIIIYYNYLYYSFINDLNATLKDFIKVLCDFSRYISLSNLRVMLRRVLVNYYKKIM